jgi:hypothetical protein
MFDLKMSCKNMGCYGDDSLYGNCLIGLVMKLTRSLETKWSMIKHDVVLSK